MARSLLARWLGVQKVFDVRRTKRKKESKLDCEGHWAFLSKEIGEKYPDFAGLFFVSLSLPLAISIIFGIAYCCYLADMKSPC